MGSPDKIKTESLVTTALNFSLLTDLQFWHVYHKEVGRYREIGIDKSVHIPVVGWAWYVVTVIRIGGWRESVLVVELQEPIKCTVYKVRP